MAEGKLRSFDLHLDYPPGTVVEVEELIDRTAGIYPCYYTRSDARLLVSTSAAELISELGGVYPNPDFQPPDYFNPPPLDIFMDSAPGPIKRKIPEQILNVLSDRGLIRENEHYYYAPETIDTRVDILKPFHRVTYEDETFEFSPTYSLDDISEFINTQIKYIEKFVHQIEKNYPNHKHLIRLGGKDSLLIALVPKITDNWYAFSAEPNYQLVRKFLDKNNVDINKLFRHDNKNEEYERDFKRKVICSDLRADPQHLRWYPTLERIMDEFDKKCIMWSGQVGGAINEYHHAYHGGNNYFNKHFTRAANWQGITQQVMKNYTECASLSIYHSEELWESVYRHYDPAMFTKGTDIREEIGSQWRDNEIWWPKTNPAPDPYEYGSKFDLEKVYNEYLSMRLSGGESWINNPSIE